MRKTSSPLARLAMAALALGILGPPPHARADDDHGQMDRDKPSMDEDRERGDHARILKSVREGKILPLTQLRAKVFEKWPGELLALSIDTEKGAIVYEFRILRSDGKLTEVEVDAANGRIIEVENE